MVVCGGGAFYAVFSGLVLPQGTKEAPEEKVTQVIPPASFVEIKPMVLSVGQGSKRQLRFHGQLEVADGTIEQVSNVMPRIQDVLNGYLRAVELADLENPAALIRLRAQMLRRIQIVTGKDQVKDLLITEFVFI